MPAASLDPAPPPAATPAAEPFTDAERQVLARYFTSADEPVFALRHLPQATCAALFARYSRSGKSLRRLFLDEFWRGDAPAGPDETAGAARATDLFSRVLAEYGDDSVAQLAGAHVACEGVSNIATKALERGRLASYLEQSTRYVPYTDRPQGRYRYLVDPAIDAAGLGGAFRRTCDDAFATYSAVLPPLERVLDGRLPPAANAGARRRAIRAAALDAARGLLPAAATSNLGIYASAQAYEALLLRLRAHPLPEARRLHDALLPVLRQVLPDFLQRVDEPDRGGVWSGYLAETAAALGAAAAAWPTVAEPPAAGPTVRLLAFDPDGERAVLTAALYPHAACPEASLRSWVDALPDTELSRLFALAVGARGNRRHRPGRGFERAVYTFEVVCDYGAFRDLQRHRMATVEWQALQPVHGVTVPELVEAAGVRPQFDRVVADLEALHRQLRARVPACAGYALALAHRVRWTLTCNAREAMHLVELRSSPQGHPEYRAVALAIRDAIRDVAGHRRIADAMSYAVDDPGPLGLAGRYAAESRRPVAGDGDPLG